MTKKEKLFCRYFATLRNPKEAAVSAGFGLLSERAASKLLARQDINEEINALGRKNKTDISEIASGLRRLAFGSVSDAVKLMLYDSLENIDIDTLDLFNVSDIKRPKGGGLEIKFFDRQKALEKLMEISKGSDSSNASSFLSALENGAKALGGDLNIGEEN